MPSYPSWPTRSLDSPRHTGHWRLVPGRPLRTSSKCWAACDQASRRPADSAARLFWKDPKPRTIKPKKADNIAVNKKLMIANSTIACPERRGRCVSLSFIRLILTSNCCSRLANNLIQKIRGLDSRCVSAAPWRPSVQITKSQYNPRSNAIRTCR